MPLSNFIDTNFISIPNDMLVGEAIELFEKHNIRWVPIVDENNKYMGAFSTHLLIKSMMPSALTLEGSGIEHANFLRGSKDKLKSNLKEMMKEKVEKYMDTSYMSLKECETDVEGLLMMYKHGSPLPVISEEDGSLKGFISHQTAIRAIKSLIK